MNINEELSESLEHYLEAIFHIEEQKQAARAKDIAERLQVTGASVTGALRILSQKKLVNYAPYDLITLTTQGRAVAEQIVHRHVTLQNFLVKVLAIDETEAKDTACKMEHAVSNTVIERLTKFIRFLEACPHRNKEWLKNFSNTLEPGQEHAPCERCLLDLVGELHSQQKSNDHSLS